MYYISNIWKWTSSLPCTCHGGK